MTFKLYFVLFHERKDSELYLSQGFEGHLLFTAMKKSQKKNITNITQVLYSRTRSDLFSVTNFYVVKTDNIGYILIHPVDELGLKVCLHVASPSQCLSKV